MASFDVESNYSDHSASSFTSSISQAMGLAHLGPVVCFSQGRLPGTRDNSRRSILHAYGQDSCMGRALPAARQAIRPLYTKRDLSIYNSFRMTDQLSVTNGFYL